uniref:Uncharacterized protein n=1 Tax=Phytophthora ramorum TaxID=164328 RepID=H3GHP7_PHYRM
MARIALFLAAFSVMLNGIRLLEAYTFDERDPSMPMSLATVVAGDHESATGKATAVNSFNLTEDDLKDSVEDFTDSSRQTALSVKLEARAYDRDADSFEDSDDAESDDTASSQMESAAAPTAAWMAAFKLGSVLNATSTIEPTYVNWVGSAFDTLSSSACWRKARIAKTCPLGFESKLGTCWAQCPYSYPIECGMECIRQNDDCGLAIFGKIAVVVQTALSLASWGMYGDMTKWPKKIQLAIKCTKYMISLTKSLVKYIRYIKVHDPQASQDKILAILYQIDNVIIDIPVAISYCIGKKASDNVKFADSVLMTAEYALREVLYNGAAIVSSWDKFAAFMKNITFGDSIASLEQTDITNMKTALESNSTCGYDMTRLLDRTWMTVAELRRRNPDISEDDIRAIMSQSNLVLNDIPIATNNCMGELIAESDEATAYATRDTLRKTFASVVDDLISSGTSNNGTFLTAEKYAFKVADRAMGFYAIWDPWYVSTVVSEYFQPICGPTELIGEIDDGTAMKALGMKIVQGAFNSSDGMWTRVGDGTVTITFKSVDTEDVTVNVKSGGDKVDEVDVGAGETVTWTSNVTALGGKTLYLDRWRPGFLGLPGTGGGSLLLWVPRSTQGGMLRLNVILNVS